MNIANFVTKFKAFTSSFSGDMLILIILLLSASASFAFGYLAGKDSTPTPSVRITETAAPKQEVSQKYVASAFGSYYYLTTCSGAKRIKEKNRVYFGSKKEAELAGYTPAKRCEGI